MGEEESYFFFLSFSAVWIWKLWWCVTFTVKRFIVKIESSLVVPWVKDAVLSLCCLGSLLRRGCDPWPGKSHIPWGAAKYNVYYENKWPLFQGPQHSKSLHLIHCLHGTPQQWWQLLCPRPPICLKMVADPPNFCVCVLCLSMYFFFMPTPIAYASSQARHRNFTSSVTQAAAVGSLTHGATAGRPVYQYLTYSKFKMGLFKNMYLSKIIIKQLYICINKMISKR